MEIFSVLGTSVKRSLEDIGLRPADTDDRADTKSRDGRDRIVHLIVSDVSVFTVNDHSLHFTSKYRCTENIAWSMG